MYCNTLVCIAEKRAEIVLQEGQVYCNRGSLAAEEIVLQYSLVGSRVVLQYKLYCELGVGLGRETARVGVGRAQLGSATRRWALYHGQARGALGLAGRRGAAGVQAGDRGARGAAGPAAGRAAGPADCALGALSFFLARFDSVLFLSQIFGHCS